MTTVEIADPPPIPGLVFRRFRGEADYPAIAELLDAHDAARGLPTVNTVEHIANGYRDPHHCDTATDMICADVDGRLAAYARVTWWDETTSGNRIYMPFGFVHPGFQGRGLGTAMLRWNESRLGEIAAGHETDRTRVMESFAQNAHGRSLLEAHGYAEYGRSADMVRPDLADIPEAPLPDGLEVRPVTDDQLRAIWEADVEAFTDHPGGRDATEADYEEFLNDPHAEPRLWRVAWEGGEVAGQVRSFVNREENERLGRLRGYTEDISVRRKWRRRGLARALLADSLRALAAEGMESAALSVYMQNPRGALGLYESMGFAVVATSYEYRKPFPA